MKMMLFAIFTSLSLSAFAASIECSELGPQAEVSISINPKTLTAQIQFGEGVTKKVKLKEIEAGGAVGIYTFNNEKMPHTITILNDSVERMVDDSEGDDRKYAVVTYGSKGDEYSYAMGCTLN